MFLLVAAILGLIFGSFLNALIFRTHADIPMTGRSKCVKCEIPIAPQDLIPIFSFFLLRGRCRSCKEVISWQYPLVEFTTAFTFVLLALYAADLSVFIAQVIITLFLIIIFFYDFQYGYILDRFTFPAMALAVVFNLALGVVTVSSMMIGVVVLGGFFFAQFAVSKGNWIGGGDIRMGILMGLWLGLERGLLATLIAYVLGALVGMGLLLLGRKQLQSHIPLGTFLAIGTFVGMVWGSEIVEWYLGYFI